MTAIEGIQKSAFWGVINCTVFDTILTTKTG